MPVKHYTRGLAARAGALRAILRTVFLRTDTKRWKEVSRQIPSWDERNRFIAAFLPDKVSVLDLGSGAQTLKTYLKPACDYQPCDIVQSSPDVILCDFNSRVYPTVRKKYDYVVCSGIFEYMRDPAGFLSEIRHYGRRMVFSYNPLKDGNAVLDRLATGWVNHLTEQELGRLFSSNDLAWRVVRRKSTSPTTEEVLFELLPVQDVAQVADDSAGWKCAHGD